MGGIRVLVCGIRVLMCGIRVLMCGIRVLVCGVKMLTRGISVPGQSQKRCRDREVGTLLVIKKNRCG